jgi:hypothetical protein
MEMLDKVEDEILAKLTGGRQSTAYIRLMDNAPQKFDSSIRRWLFIQKRELFDPSSNLSLKKVREIMEDLLLPRIKGSTVCNNFYLRFPDFSPLFPTRSIKSKLMFFEYMKVSQAPTFVDLPC